MKKTVVIGANDNPEKYAYKAANMLVKYGHAIVPLGIKEGEVAGNTILTNRPELKDIDTVTLYVSPKNQTGWFDYIIDLKPKRVIFNPGTENIAFEQRLKENGITPIEGCTLVMLSTKTY